MSFVQFQWRRDTAANWTSANPVLASGEPGLETDTKKYKIGDGATAWTSLAYVSVDIAATVHAAASKATPVDADELALIDSAAANALKRLTWGNLKAAAKSYFDTLYQPELVSGTNIKTINGTSVLGAGNIPIAAGTNGIDGKTVLSGTGAPASGLGTDGDFYIDTAAAYIYGPKAGGVWPSGISLVGPAGASGEMGTYTWATKPAASANTGQRIRISDYGIAPGLIVVSDGARWLVDGRQVLARSTVNSTAITGTTAETTFSTGTFTIPADLLGPNGTLAVSPIVGFTSNANNKSVRIRYAGTLVAGWTGANQTTLQLPATVYNRGSASAQAGMWGTTATSIGFTTAAVNTAVDVVATITGQLTNAADSTTLHGYIIEILP